MDRKVGDEKMQNFSKLNKDFVFVNKMWETVAKVFRYIRYNVFKYF